MDLFDTVEDLIPRAEIFRSKLIEDFQLLDSINKTTTEVPKYYSSELSDSPASMAKMLRESPHAVVKFQLYNSKVESTYDDRRLNRVKTKHTIPFGPWAKMVVENQWFQNFLLFLILGNSIVLGIQAEISNVSDESVLGLKLVLDIFDYLSLIVFILEILLKWVDEFWDFWKNGWNNFDFFVTVMSLLPELIKLASGKMTTPELAVIAENLRVFRILRSLKMVSRFAQLRIIVLTILKAFKSMVFILTLLSVFMYIFAVAGTVLFDSIEKSKRTDLAYKQSFSSLGQSLATLFQLFTLDHWFDVLNDMLKVADGLTSKCYIILWICIGAFIFRNIFAGIMVMNFQNIRTDFANQCQEKENEIEEEGREKLLEVELAMQYTRNSMAVQEDGTGRRTSMRRESLQVAAQRQSLKLDKNLSSILEGSSSDDSSENGEEVFPLPTNQNSSNSTAANQNAEKLLPNDNTNDVNNNKDESVSCKETDSYASIIEELKKQKSKLLGDNGKGEETENYPECSGWNNTVRMNLNNLANNNKETLWPRDTLFRYFQLMEALQDNLAERSQLQQLAVLAVSNLHDSRPKSTS